MTFQYGMRFIHFYLKRVFILEYRKYYVTLCHSLQLHYIILKGRVQCNPLLGIWFDLHFPCPLRPDFSDNIPLYTHKGFKLHFESPNSSF